MKKPSHYVIFLFFPLLLIGCNQASVDGNIHIKLHRDGSAEYTFSILTNPYLLKYFDEYKENLEKHSFQISEKTTEMQTGWVATKTVESVLDETSPLDIFTSNQNHFNDSIQVHTGFFTNQLSINYPLDLTQVINDERLTMLYHPDIHLDLMLTLPVEVKEHNAAIVSEDRKTLTWKLNIGEVNHIQAEVTIFNPISWLVTAGIIVMTVMISLIYLRKKKKELQQKQKGNRLPF